jgi:two-component system chemotaxis response regulator CheY
MKILVVDDSKTMRNVQKGVLTQLGYTDIVEAADGLDALSKATGESLHFMLVDWNMPNKDGLSFVKDFRAKDTDTPIIMVTTEAEKSRVIEAIKAGVNNYVVKPFTPEQLTERINDTLSKAGAA